MIRCLRILIILLMFSLSWGDISTGLVGWWKLDGNALDSSGNGNNGTIYGATPTVDRFGVATRSISFEGSNYLEVGALDSVNGISQLTIAGWAKRVSGYGAMFYKNGAHSYNNWIEVTWHYSEQLYFIVSYNVGASIPIPIGTDWKFYTFVFDGTQTGNSNRMKIFVNGLDQMLTFFGDIPSTTSSPSGPANIGRDYWNSTTFGGAFSDVRIYNRALSDADVAQLYSYTGKTGGFFTLTR